MGNVPFFPGVIVIGVDVWLSRLSVTQFVLDYLRMSVVLPHSRSRGVPPSCVLQGITCSMCQDRIEVGKLGDHVCRSRSGEGEGGKGELRRPRAGVQGYRQSSSRSVESSRSYVSNQTLSTTAGPSLAAARNTTNLKIDVGAVSKYSGVKKQQDGRKDQQQQQRVEEEQRSGVDAGMAGVGRRAFAGIDYDGQYPSSSVVSIPVLRGTHLYPAV